MKQQEPWQEWNMMFMMLIQATRGQISDNMRRVGLRKANEDWIVEVVLEKPSEVDEEEALEFASELSIFSEGECSGRVYSRVVINDGQMADLPGFSGFEGALYQRKESGVN